MTEVLNSDYESKDSLESFCAMYAQRVLELMDRDLYKTASALSVDSSKLFSLVARGDN
ncbi:MAG: hypothetical protein IT366_20020 [Candidatus Hydrogenedentes bacterium]|nr:hypothetical protein [Candidatus Hydrogenedentota bacterium]